MRTVTIALCLLLTVNLAAQQPTAEQTLREVREGLKLATEALERFDKPPEITHITLTLQPGDSLEDAVRMADLPTVPVTILVPPTYSAQSLRLPARTTTHVIEIRSAGELPPAGVRVSPALAVQMPKLGGGRVEALTTAPGTGHYVIRGFEFLPVAVSELVSIHGSVTKDAEGRPVYSSDPASQAHHITLAQNYIHGDPAGGQRRCVRAEGIDIRITDNYIADCFQFGVEAQAVAFWNSAGPYLIENNYLEGAGEVMMVGGDWSPIGNALGAPPCDITVRGNFMTKKPEWRTMTTVINGRTTPVIQKNVFELKFACRVTVERNVFERNPLQAQAGSAVLVTAKRQDERPEWARFVRIEDVIFRHNVLRDSAAGFNVHGEHGPARDITVENNIIRNLDRVAYGGTGEPFLVHPSNAHNVRIIGNTVIGATGSKFLQFASRGTMPGFEFTRNIVEEKSYGMQTSGAGFGLAALQAATVDAVFTGNVIFDGAARTVTYPAGNRLIPVGTVPAAQFNPDGSFADGSVLAGVEAGANVALLPQQ